MLIERLNYLLMSDSVTGLKRLVIGFLLVLITVRRISHFNIHSYCLSFHRSACVEFLRVRPDHKSTVFFWELLESDFSQPTASEKEIIDVTNVLKVFLKFFQHFYL